MSIGRAAAHFGVALVASVLGIGCTPSDADRAYEDCVNAEAEAKFDAAAAACQRAIELDPRGGAADKARAKLAAMAPHLAPATSASASARASAGPPPSSTPPPAPSASADADGSIVPTTQWFEIEKGSATLGTVRVSVDEKPLFALETTGDDADALAATWKELDTDKGLPLKMHLPPPGGGNERGPLGSRIIPPGDPLFVHAVRDALGSAGYTLDELPQTSDVTLPSKIEALHISRNRDRLGTLSFKGLEPVLTLAAKSVDTENLESRWKSMAEGDVIKLRYHHPTKAGPHELATLEAGPKDPEWRNAVRLALMFWYFYDVEAVAGD